MDPASRRLYYNRCHPFDTLDPGDELARVAMQQYLIIDGDADREVADRLLQNNVILRYLNEEAWFDIHPAVRRIPGVSEEIARQQNKQLQAV